MRLRNVDHAKEIIENSPYLILEPKKIEKKTLFLNDNPIHIEIGMGKGQFLIQMALKYPNINFVGIEKFDNVIVRAIQKLEDLSLPNLKLIRMDALEIDEVFEKQVDTIYLNFSDPWPKKRHQLRRLTSPVFLNKYEKVFKQGPHIILKTDNRNLFEYSIISLSQFGYTFNEITLDLYQEKEIDNVPTEYEIRFSNQGKPIYRLNAKKIGQNVYDNQ